MAERCAAGRDGYRALASVYDRLNGDVDYEAWADFICRSLEREGIGKGASLLELGCGTGSMTMALARRGFDLIALDRSEEMLAVAQQRIVEAGLSDILLLSGDMTDFELYGTVDAVVCCLDGINHLTKREEAAACFQLVQNYLNPGGVFLFDLNTPYKFRTKYADNDYILEEDGAVCCWQNRLNKRGDLCDFYLTVFERLPNGLYRRTDGVERERCYGFAAVKRLLVEAGLTFGSVVSGYDFAEVTETAERWYFMARKPL